MAMMYELIMTYDDGTLRKEQAKLPDLMTALGIYMEDNSWTYAQIMNCQTGELIARWANVGAYGATVI